MPPKAPTKKPPKTKGGGGGHQGRITVPKSTYDKKIKKSKSIPAGLLLKMPMMTPNQMNQSMPKQNMPHMPATIIGRAIRKKRAESPKPKTTKKRKPV